MRWGPEEVRTCRRLAHRLFEGRIGAGELKEGIAALRRGERGLFEETGGTGILKQVQHDNDYMARPEEGADDGKGEAGHVKD